MYTKVAPDLQEATARGGFFTLVAAGLMAWMLCVETYVFLGTGPVRERIDLDASLQSDDSLRMNINLSFPRLACEDVTLELWRAKKRSAAKDIDRTLVVSRFNPTTGKTRAYRRVEGDAAPAGFGGCRLEGYVNGYNSPGAFKVTAPPERNLSHTIHAFTFGTRPTRDQSRALLKVGEKYRKLGSATLDGADYWCASPALLF